MRKIIVLSVALIACGKDRKVEQAKGEVTTLAASVAAQTKGDEGSLGPCPGLQTFALDPALPKNDPWGHAYTLECGNGFVVVSQGPDGQPGTKDDVRSPGRRNPSPP